ncbi:MAG TPA: methyl-accepting chemotaxis protein [Candidatus Sulfotelmatobacter sp.]|nr:methyl-accepting chemotaxis protein [Candidatus Sulfotelmatobacter sp.]
MERYRAVAARFARRRLLAIVISFPAALIFVTFVGVFTVPEAEACFGLAALLTLIVPIYQTIALRRALAPVRRALTEGAGDAPAIASRLRGLVPHFVIAWFLAFLVIPLIAVPLGNGLVGLPSAQNLVVGVLGTLLCWAMYASLLSLALEEALATWATLTAEALHAQLPPPRVTAGGIAGRIILVVTVTAVFVTTVTGAIAVRGESNDRTLAFALTCVVVIAYAFFAARFLADAIAAPLGKLARALDRVADGDFEALSELRTLPRTSHEVGIVLHSLAGAEASLREVSHAAVRLADGDLATTITPRGEGDFLTAALARLLGAVRDVLRDARGAAGALDAGSADADANAAELRAVSSGIADDLQATSASVEELERTTIEAGAASVDVAHAVSTVQTSADRLEDLVRDTAAALEQLASSVERSVEIAGTIRALAHTAEDVATRAGNALSDATGSGERAALALGSTLEGIEALHEASERIGAITETIDEISDQTNLLALNAAIEAARAGDHGRGFAVVADEIRGLASRAAQANAEIAAVVRDVQRRTGSAVASTREGNEAARAARAATGAASDALGAIRRDVGEVARRLDDVGHANDEQKSTTEALMRATTAVREQAAQNRTVADNLSALAEHLARAASEGADASTHTRSRVAALVQAGETVASEAAALLQMTGTLRDASARLNAAIARFHDDLVPTAEVGALRAPTGQLALR